MDFGSELMSKLNKRFTEIGTKNGLAFPEDRFTSRYPESNQFTEIQFTLEKTLYEYMVAKAMKSHAERREKDAMSTIESLSQHGLFKAVKEDFDVTCSKLALGDHVLYNGSVLSLSVKLTRGGTSVDHDKFVAELRKAGVSAETIEKATVKATKINSNRRSFSVAVTSRD